MLEASKENMDRSARIFLGGNCIELEAKRGAFTALSNLENFNGLLHLCPHGLLKYKRKNSQKSLHCLPNWQRNVLTFLSHSVLGTTSNMHGLCLLQEDTEFSVYVPLIVCANLTQ